MSGAGRLPQRAHAWLMFRVSGRYERLVGNRKRELLGALDGDVLEIGPGTGPNLRYLRAEVRWTGVEPNPYMHAYLRRAAGALGREVALHEGGAESLPLGDGTVDAVVSTLVLCSVRRPEEALREVWRVLKPGGRFVFLEHVAAARGSTRRRWQRILRPVWRMASGGCRLDQDTLALIHAAGFREVRVERFALPLGPVGAQIAGHALK